MKDATFSAARLLKLYDRISDTEGAISKLRHFLLDLAVRGKLVEQDISEAPQSVGVAPLIDEAPYRLPSNWRWMAIGDQLELLNGMAFKPTDWISEGLRIVRIQNLNKPDAPFNHCAPELARDRSLIDDGSFLISWSGTPGTSFGAFIWDRGPAVLNQHIFRCDFKTDAYRPDFLKLAINGRLDEMIEKAHGGVGLRHITKGKLQAMLIAVPPLAEQHRIVAKVDELMALCDQLEQARAGREAVRDRLTTATLARLTAPETDEKTLPAEVGTALSSGNATNSSAFQSHARFALQSLPTLTTRPDQIKTLRQTILNLAVRGKLVAQDAADEPASALLKRIEAGSDRTAKRGARRSNEEDNSDFPFDCPKGWVWTVVQQILDPEREISYGVIKLGAEPKSGGVPTLRCSDVRPGFIDLSGVRKVNETIESEYARTRLNGGEILINIRGTLGGVALVSEKLKGFNVAREVAVVPIAKEIVPQFVVYLMLSPYFWDHIQSNLRGIAYKGLNLGILRSLPIPLPPLAEQHRIVDKVDALMALCDQLEASLTTTAKTRSKLLNALLHEALEPAAETANA
ncbi:restriction endonuclease subunit S [Litoreibacter arenae]|uniref:Type I restriction-modification system, specificity subunit S n=1 Tax=Litoreibacter arenae DSM 19593 TaxID=1123360 RepID=S9QD05_9RHOB|nr:restriction endonuclease subunit S [Litoreibacter arenae]EPX79321.1 Type I restriction-modification system, specificity subunit S [Litoreibacter arenae DSM 19593]